MVSFWPWGRDRTSPASFEKTLSALSAKINTTQASLDQTRASSRRIKVLWVLYTGFAYLAYAILELVAVGHKNMGAMEWIFMAAGPILIILIRKLIGVGFDLRINSFGKRLRHYQGERAKTIQQLKDATRYDSTMELIEKYGGEKKKDEAQGNDGNKEKKNSLNRMPDTLGRTRMPPPPTANIQPYPSTDTAAPPVSDLAPVESNPQSNGGSKTELQADFATNASSSRSTTSQGQSFGAGGGESHWYDRIFDVLLGEDETAPKNRFVLICQSCRLVNGQAPPGSSSLSDVGPWHCMRCHAKNGEVDEGKRIFQEVLASSPRQQNSSKGGGEDAEEKLEAITEQTALASSSKDEQASATGAGTAEVAKRRNKGKK